MKRNRVLSENAELLKLKSQLNAPPSTIITPDPLNARRVFDKLKKIARALQLKITPKADGRIHRIEVDLPTANGLKRVSVKPIMQSNQLFLITRTEIRTPNGRIVRKEEMVPATMAVGMSDINKP